MEDDREHDSTEERIPTGWWVGGLLVSGAFCTALLTPMLGLPLKDPLAAVGLALLVAVLAVRALGQTDLNPVSGVGKLSQVKQALCCIGSGIGWLGWIGLASTLSVGWTSFLIYKGSVLFGGKAVLLGARLW